MQPIDVFTELYQLGQAILAGQDTKASQGKRNQKIQSADTRCERLKQQLPEQAQRLDWFFKLCEGSAITSDNNPQLTDAFLNPNHDAHNDNQCCDPQMYATLLPLTQIMYDLEQNGDAYEHAYKLAVLFDSIFNVLKYWQALVNNWYQSNLNNKFNDQPMHEACQFALPQGTFDLATWRLFAQKYYNDKVFWDLLPNAASIEREIKSWARNRQKPPIPETLKSARANVQKNRKDYNNLRRHRGELTDERKNKQQQLLQSLLEAQQHLTQLAPDFSHQLTLEDLRAFKEVWMNRTSHIYKYFLQHNLTANDYFYKFLSWQRYDNDHQIPPILINGADLSDELSKYYLRKLNVEDDNDAALAAVLGKLTGCCQSLGEHGEDCVRHGLTSANGGFYVLFKGETAKPSASDPVIAQAWTWRSQSKALVFDSIESQHNWPMIVSFYRALAKCLVENQHTYKVVCGRNSGIRNDSFLATKWHALERFKEGDQPKYNDSKQQSLVYERYLPHYWYHLDCDEQAKTHDLLDQILANPQRSLALYHSLSDMVQYALHRDDRTLLNVIRSKAKNHNQQQSIHDLINNMGQYVGGHLSLERMIDAIDNEKLPVNTRTSQGETPLIQILKYGSNETAIYQHCRRLCSKNAAINAVDEQNNTALKLALEYEYLTLAKLIIEKGADIDVYARDRPDTTPQRGGRKPLTVAVQKGDMELIEQLVQKGAAIDRTAFKCAISKGDVDLVKLLIEKGANLFDKSMGGSTPMIDAIDYGYNDIVKLLIANGSMLNTRIWARKLVTGSVLKARDAWNHTPLMEAIINGRDNIIKTLIEQGADVHLRNDHNQSALDIAVEYDSSLEVLLTLYEAGSQLTLKSNRAIKAKLHSIDGPKVDAALWQIFYKRIEALDTIIANHTDNSLTAKIQQLLQIQARVMSLYHKEIKDKQNYPNELHKVLQHHLLSLKKEIEQYKNGLSSADVSHPVMFFGSSHKTLRDQLDTWLNMFPEPFNLSSYFGPQRA